MGRNPFNVIKFRTHVLSTFIAIYLALITFFLVLEYKNILPWSVDDRLWQPINSMIIFGAVCGILLVTGQRAGLRIRHLFGRVPRFPLGYGLLLITSMFIFSLSSALLLFYPISLFAPGFVEERLSQQLFEMETVVPGIYKGLMLFVALVFAPFTEEFIFRGVLLQRWAVLRRLLVVAGDRRLRCQPPVHHERHVLRGGRGGQQGLLLEHELRREGQGHEAGLMRMRRS